MISNCFLGIMKPCCFDNQVEAYFILRYIMPMNLIHLVLASPLIWFVMYWFFCNYSFSAHREHPERFLRGNLNLLATIENSFRTDFESRFRWFCSTRLVIVFLFGLLCCVSHLFLNSHLFIGIFYSAHLAISAYLIAQTRCAKEALRNLTGECSVKSMSELKERWVESKGSII